MRPLAVLSLVRELRTGVGDTRPLVVAGVPALVPALARELRRDGDSTAVREGGSPTGAAALVYILERDPSAEDLELLKEAARADVPIVAVTEAEHVSIPYVLATDVVRVRPGAGFPIDEIGAVLGRRLGEAGTALAARLPAIRRPICDALIRRFSRRNGLIGVAVFIPGADTPVLTLNQIRLVLRIALAHGDAVDASRALELAGTVAVGLGFRTLARELLGAVPVAGWLIKGGIAYAGTRAIGEAALRYYDAGAPLAKLLPSGS